MSFAAAIVAIRLLGSHDFGLVSAVLAHVALFHYALSMGFDHTLPVIAEQERLSRTTLLGILFAAIVGLLLLLVAGSILPVGEEYRVLVWVLGASAIFTSSSVILSGYLRATGQFGALIFKDQIITPTGTLLASSLALYVFGATAQVYAMFYLATAASAFAFGLWRWSAGAASGAARHAVAEREFLRASAPTAITLVLENVVPFGIVAVLAYTASAADVGVFSTLQRFGQLTLFAGVAVAPIVSGLLPKLMRRSDAEAENLFRMAVVLSLSWALGMSCACIIFSDEISRLIGLDATVPLLALVPLLLGFALDGGFGHVKLFLIAKDDGVANARMMSIAAAVAVVGAYFGSLRWGLVGASGALFAAYVVLTLLRLSRVRSIARLAAFRSKDFAVLALAGVPMGLLTVAATMIQIDMSMRVAATAALGVYWAGILLRVYGNELSALRTA